MTLIDKLAWIENRDGAILSTRSRGKRTWYIPGGKREGNESDQQALAREIREELSVDLVLPSIRHYGDFEEQADGHMPGVRVCMQCYTAAYVGRILAASEIEEVGWLTTANIDTVSPVDRLIFAQLKSEGRIR